MAWRNQLNSDSLAWLLERDPANPGVRYFALRDLLERSSDDPDLCEAQVAVMASGPVPAILDAQHRDGYWQVPGGGYLKYRGTAWQMIFKYRGTAWQMIFLGELGADASDVRVQRGCEYLLGHTLAANSGFACSNTNPVPSRVIHCLNGTLLASLIRLGRLEDARVQQALVWQACAITGDVPISYYRSGTSGPEFACVANDQQPCGWGATKALKALAAVPQNMIDSGNKASMNCVAIGADRPTATRPSGALWTGTLL